jgi:hypothetical protein
MTEQNGACAIMAAFLADARQVGKPRVRKTKPLPALDFGGRIAILSHILGKWHSHERT